MEENEELTKRAEAAISKMRHAGIDVNSEEFKNHVKMTYMQCYDDTLKNCDTPEEAYAEASKHNHRCIINADTSKWNAEHERKMIENFKENEKLVDELRNLGICYDPTVFKRTYGFVNGRNVDLNNSLENYMFEESQLHDGQETCDTLDEGDI